MGQVNGVLTTVSSSAILYLTRDSPRKHRITGSVLQRIYFPLVNDIELGTEFVVFNQSTADVIMTDSAGLNPQTIIANSAARFTLVDKAGSGLWLIG